MTERMSVADLRSELRTPRRNKYGAKKTTVDGITFDSMREAKRYKELRVKEWAGQIRDLKLQVPIMLEGRNGPILTRSGRHMRLTVDFSYVDVASGLTIYEDSKGMATRDYEVRKGVAAAQGVEVIEV